MENKPNASDPLTADEVAKMWEMDILGAKSGWSLQFTLWFYFTTGFGLRGRD